VTPQVDVLVLAGGDGSALDPQLPVKGLVELAGKPMVQWVLEALRAAQTVREIVVVIPPGYDISHWEQLADYIAYSDGSFADNIAAGLDKLRQDTLVVGVTSDIPALVPEAIDDIVVQTFARNADFSYPLIREEVVCEQFPTAERTFVKIRGGRVTGGNAMVFDPQHFPRLRAFTQEMFNARKNPVKMARIVGPKFIIKLRSGQLEPRDVEKRLTKLLGMNGVAIYSPYACIGADVDKPEDIAPTEAVLKARSG